MTHADSMLQYRLALGADKSLRTPRGKLSHHGISHMTQYCEAFADGPGGWYGYQDGPGQNQRALEWSAGKLTSRSPWWIDYNHAPPGIGYFHMLFCLNTFGPQSEEARDQGGPNRYIAAGMPIDFTGARVTARLRGELTPTYRQSFGMIADASAVLANEMATGGTPDGLLPDQLPELDSNQQPSG